MGLDTSSFQGAPGRLVKKRRRCSRAQFLFLFSPLCHCTQRRAGRPVGRIPTYAFRYHQAFDYYRCMPRAPFRYAGQRRRGRAPGAEARWAALTLSCGISHVAAPRCANARPPTEFPSGAALLPARKMPTAVIASRRRRAAGPARPASRIANGAGQKSRRRAKRTFICTAT